MTSSIPLALVSCGLENQYHQTPGTSGGHLCGITHAIHATRLALRCQSRKLPKLQRAICLAGTGRKPCSSCSALTPLTHAARWAFCSEVDTQKLTEDENVQRGWMKGDASWVTAPAGFFCWEIRQCGKHTGRQNHWGSFHLLLCMCNT